MKCKRCKRDLDASRFYVTTKKGVSYKARTCSQCTQEQRRDSRLREGLPVAPGAGMTDDESAFLAKALKAMAWRIDDKCRKMEREWRTI